MALALKPLITAQKVKPRREIVTPPELDRAGPHYVTTNVKFPTETERGQKNELVPSTRGLKTEGTSVKGVKVHGQSVTDCTPHRSSSAVFFLTCFPHLSPTLSFCTMEYRYEYHCGAEIPSLTFAGLHNENK